MEFRLGEYVSPGRQMQIEEIRTVALKRYKQETGELPPDDEPEDDDGLAKYLGDEYEDVDW